jgi:hypothetical protein
MNVFNFNYYKYLMNTEEYKKDFIKKFDDMKLSDDELVNLNIIFLTKAVNINVKAQAIRMIIDKTEEEFAKLSLKILAEEAKC